MNSAQDYLAGLAQLHGLASAEERRAAWRQGLTALSAVANHQPAPLEGLSPEGLLASARSALHTGLVDDVSFLARPVAAAALFELAAALPPGPEKSDLGRRVGAELHTGDGPTFASVARALALAVPRALGETAVRARVALSLQLPIGEDAGVNALALALISRPELEREWLSAPSTGSYAARHQAARLLERAACEVERQARRDGNLAGLRAFEGPNVRAAWASLLVDRESLVWRYVAVARGLLAATVPALADDIKRDLAPGNGPAEWRRGATSLAATVAHDAGRALARCRDLVASEICRRDPGIKMALVFGLSRAGEEEPEATDELMELLASAGEIDVIEALVDLRRLQARSEFGARAVAKARASLRSDKPVADDGLAALAQSLAQELAPDDPLRPRTIEEQVTLALRAFAEGSDFGTWADAALVTARRLVGELEDGSDGSPEGRRRAFMVLHHLERGLMETTILRDLLAARGPEAGVQGAAALDALLARVHDWVCKREESPLASREVPHLTVRLRRMRALLHALDGESRTGDAAAGVGRARRLRAFQLLLGRVQADPPSAMRRITCAALARAGDALVREDIGDLSDVVVAILTKVRAADDLHALGEASMASELNEILRASAELARLVTGASPAQNGENGESSEDGNARGGTFLHAFQQLAQTLPLAVSPRVEGLRRALMQMARALQRLNRVSSLAALKHASDGSPLQRLEEAAQYLARFCSAARRRMALTRGPLAPPLIGRALQALEGAVDQAVLDPAANLAQAVRAADSAAAAELPAAIADPIRRVLARLESLPRESAAGASPEAAAPRQADPRLRLPSWLPPNRVVGGFYVLRAIGSGAAGSVFVARRAEERHDDKAQTYAVKFPSYDGQNARTLTEQEFLQTFRQEAGALLTLPPNRNLAGFVTFDAGARPKPILVMELVPGATLERLLDKRELTMSTAFHVLDGIAHGLGAMHATGIAHLDVKPANIILRAEKGTSDSSVVRLDSLRPTPVLVDFGLAGRKIRPGCASPYYGAPEVWDPVAVSGTNPTAADVYGFCCMGYELCTGRPLFQADTLPALISCHFDHDGNPPGLAVLEESPQLAPLAQIFSTGLKPDPARRATIAEIRDALANVAADLSDASWPLAA